MDEAQKIAEEEKLALLGEEEKREIREREKIAKMRAELERIDQKLADKTVSLEEKQTLLVEKDAIRKQMERKSLAHSPVHAHVRNLEMEEVEELSASSQLRDSEKTSTVSEERGTSDARIKRIRGKEITPEGEIRRRKTKRAVSKELIEGSESSEDDERNMANKNMSSLFGEDKEDTIDSIRDNIQEIKNWSIVAGKTNKKLTVGERTKLMDIVAKLENLVLKEALEKENLRGYVAGANAATDKLSRRLDEWKMDQSMMVPMQEGMKKEVETYADKAKKKPGVPGVRGLSMRQRNEVVIKREGKDADEVKSEVKRIVDPKELGIHVKRVLKVKRGVVVEVDSKEEAEKLKNCINLINKGYKVEGGRKKNPVIMIYGVEQGDEEDMLRELYERNVQPNEISEEEFLKGMNVRHKMKMRSAQGRNDARNREIERKENWIIECEPRIRNLLRRKDRVFLGWESCQIKDYVDVPRCFKCHRYGHVAKVCTEKENKCAWCGKGHRVEDCEQKEEDLHCVNCKRENGARTDHPAHWKKCPVYERAVKRYFESVTYDSDN